MGSEALMSCAGAEPLPRGEELGTRMRTWAGLPCSNGKARSALEEGGSKLWKRPLE